MADSRRKKELQLAHSTNALTYGHLGTADYSAERREWTFLRNLSTISLAGEPPGLYRNHPVSAFPFELVYHARTHDARSISAPKASWTAEPPRQYQSYDRLLQLDSNLGPCIGLVRREEPFSEAIKTSIEAFDQNLSERLAFGSACWLLKDVVHPSRVTIPIVAMVSGSAGEAVKLLRMNSGAVNLSSSDGSDASIMAPQISTDEEAWWTGNGEPIQQICFSSTSGRQSPWMAVRQPSSTTIFHPFFHKRPVPARRVEDAYPQQPRPPSRLDANPILTIPISRTGGNPLADVSFRPLHHEQIALVDQHGNWSVWQIEGKRAITVRTLFRVRLQYSGKLFSWDHEERNAKTRPYHDGWHKICWLTHAQGSSGRILICNRRTAAIYNAGAELLQVIDLRLGPLREMQWILDIKTSNTRTDHCFIVTSTKVFWLSMAAAEMTDADEPDVLTTLLSWRHFQSREDLTLGLTLIEMTSSTVLLLHSHSTKFCLAFRVAMSPGNSHLPVSLCDPVSVDLSSPFNMRQAPAPQVEVQPPLTLIVRELQCRRMHSLDVGSKGPIFFKMFMFDVNFGVVEILYRTLESDIQPTLGWPSSTVLLLPAAERHQTESSQSPETESLSEFVVDEDSELLQDHALGLCGPSFESVQQTAQESPLNWEDIYKISSTPANGAEQDTQVEFDTVIEKIRGYIRESGGAISGLQLLSEMCTDAPYVDDVYGNSQMLQTLVKDLTHANGGASIHPCGLSRLAQAEDRDSTILELYDYLISNWLAPFSSDAPDRMRVYKERLARSIAAEVALASNGVLPTDQLSTGPNSDANRTLHLATSPPPSLRQDLVSSSQPLSSSPAPILYVASADELERACSRLRLYTKCTRPRVPSTSMDKLSDLLAHLPTDIDIEPSSYNWRHAEASIAARQTDEAAKMANPKARRKAQRRAEAKRQKVETQHKEAEEIRQQRAAPAILSSPGLSLGRREARWSSQAMGPGGLVSSQDMPMTQPERGVFGGRRGEKAKDGKAKDGKAKGKKRAAGF